jgi:hypothetical protein
MYEPGGSDIEGLLRLIPGDMFGPPEKCYYRSVSDYPGLLYAEHGKGAAMCFPWGIGAHYQRQCHQGHARLVLGAVDSLLGPDRRLRVSACPLVEVTHRAGENGRFEWVALFNLSGQRGNALHAPVPMQRIRIDLEPRKRIKTVRLLRADTELPFSKRSDRIEATIPQLDHYEVVLFEYAD